MKDFIQVNNIRFKNHDKGTIGQIDNAPTDIFCTNQQISLSGLDFKENISNLGLSLDFIDKLQPVEFKWKNGERKHFGLIAEKVKEIIDNEGIDSNNFAAYIEDNDKKGLRYVELLPILINGIKDLYEQNIWLTTKMAELLEVIDECCNEQGNDDNGNSDDDDNNDNNDDNDDNNSNENKFEVRLVANNAGQYRIKYDIYVNNNSDLPIEVTSLKIYLRGDTYKRESLDNTEVIPANSNVKLHTEYRDIQVEGVHQLYCDIIIDSKIITLFETITI